MPSHWCAAVLISLCSSGGDVVAQPDVSAPPASADTEAKPVDPTDWAATLIETGQAQPIADELRTQTDWARFSALVSLLVKDDQTALLSDKLVLDALLARIDEAPTPVLQQILPIVGADFERDAIRKVIHLLDAVDPALRALAMRTLVDQTGREDLGQNRDAWRQWWAEHEWIPEIEWLRRVAMWQSHRARLTITTATDVNRRLVLTLRELYTATSRQKRPDLLLRLLRDPTADVRRLGVELASREIVNATPLSDETLDAAVDLLRDPYADLRTGAAHLFGAATSAEYHRSLSKALASEKDPNVAGAFLSALSADDPSRTDVAAAVKWIGNPLAQAPAARVLFSAADSGKLVVPSQNNAVWSVISADAGASLGPVGVRLFGRMAPAADLEMLFSLLGSPQNTIRDAAARALADRRVGLSRLLEAARSDSSLTLTALEALSLWKPTASGWRLARTLPGSTDKGLASFASSLPPGEAIEAAEKESSAPHRLVLLDRFGKPAALAESLSRSDLTGAALLRLRTLLDLGRYEDVLHNSQPPSWLTKDPRFIASRTVALLALGRLDEAVKTGADAEVWFDAIHRLMDAKSNLAPDVVRRFRQVWFSGLSAPDQKKLTEIEKKLGIDILAMPDGGTEAESPDSENG